MPLRIGLGNFTENARAISLQRLLRPGKDKIFVALSITLDKIDVVNIGHHTKFIELFDLNHLLSRAGLPLATEMSHLIVAQRSYQANVSVFERARDSYQRVLEIGR